MIKVLDHGFVRLIDHMGSDLSIVRAARNSHDAAWRAGEDENKDERLIHYLWKNKHTTPFEAATISLEVKAPIFVFRQWHRHRTQSYNEVSARYTELPGEFYVPLPNHIGAQDSLNKQARDFTREMLGDEYIKIQDQIERYKITCECSVIEYKELLALGWPRELARMCLPLSTYSKMFTAMNLLNCFRFLTLRHDSHTQYEIRVYAETMLELIRPLFPVAVNAWETYK